MDFRGKLAFGISRCLRSPSIQTYSRCWYSVTWCGEQLKKIYFELKIYKNGFVLAIMYVRQLYAPKLFIGLKRNSLFNLIQTKCMSQGL